ncbi:MAG: hypothetical protein JW737_01415 [Acidobacteria bacterium]|nr:hypothetical protein [Acidobacteriota bacterium]
MTIFVHKFLKVIKISGITLFSLILLWFAISAFTALSYKTEEIEPVTIPEYYNELRGAVHMHTTYTDGIGNPEDIIEAAKEENLDFVVLTDWAIEPEWKIPKDGQVKPLFIIGTERNTGEGHVLGYGLEKPIDEVTDSLEDSIWYIRNSGGIAVAAHPHRRKNSWLRWDLDVDGIEVLNFSAVALNAKRSKVFWKLPQAFFNARGTILSLLTYPELNIKKWDSLLSKKKQVGFCGTDAHGPFFLGIPSYSSLIGAINIHIIGKPAANQQARDFINQSLKYGNFYNCLDGLAISRYFDFRVITTDGKTYGMGDTALLSDGLTVALDYAAPKGAYYKIFRNGKLFREEKATSFHGALTEDGVYRVEIWLSEDEISYPREMIWIISNPIKITKNNSTLLSEEIQEN